MDCFHGISAAKEPACNSGDPSLIPGLGRSPAEGIVHPLQYSWAPLGAQMVMNPPAMWEAWVWSLSWEDRLEDLLRNSKENILFSGEYCKQSTPIFLPGGSPWTEDPGGLQSMVSQRVRQDWATKHAAPWIETHHKWYIKVHYVSFVWPMLVLPLWLSSKGSTLFIWHHWESVLVFYSVLLALLVPKPKVALGTSPCSTLKIFRLVSCHWHDSASLCLFLPGMLPTSMSWLPGQVLGNLFYLLS